MLDVLEKTEEVETLIELNEDLENYFHSTVIPQLFVDANLILRKFTPPAMKAFNLKETDVDRPIEQIGDNIRYSTLIEDIKKVIDTNQILEKEIQTTDFRWYQLDILPYIVQKEKKTNGVIITFIDVTKRIRALKEMEKLNHNLIKLNADHETFIYSVSHNLKGPLQNIDGLNNGLMDAVQSGIAEEIKTYVDMLNSSIRGMKKIIEELTDISKIKGNFIEEVEQIHFEDVMEEVELTLKEMIYSSSASITRNFVSQEINFSRKNIRSIIYNLLSNAIKYKSPDRKPHIAIKTEISGKFLLISVKDNGVGIADDMKEMIFSQFTRINKDVEGTGIGLYIIKRIVDNNEGKIVVDSEVGKWSEFKIYLKV